MGVRESRSFQSMLISNMKQQHKGTKQIQFPGAYSCSCTSLMDLSKPKKGYDTF